VVSEVEAAVALEAAVASEVVEAAVAPAAFEAAPRSRLSPRQVRASLRTPRLSAPTQQNTAGRHRPAVTARAASDKEVHPPPHPALAGQAVPAAGPVPRPACRGARIIHAVFWTNRSELPSG
jgi:hypothetical protein